MSYSFLIEIILILIPLYVANSSAMLFAGKTQMDFNLNFFDEKPLFGKGKSIKGTFFGVISGIISVLILDFYFQGNVPIIPQYVFYGILLSFGAIMGDVAASFVKRRFDITTGKPILLLDQLDFVVGVILFGSLIYSVSAEMFLLICFITLIAHKASNFLAFKLKIKKVPW